MRIATLDVNQVSELVFAPHGGEVAILPQTGDAAIKATSVRANEHSLGKRHRRETLAEALLDGFMGVQDADYGKLVKFVERLRDHSPALAVQLLKPLLRTEATPTVNVEQQAIFIFGDVPKENTPDNKTEAIDVE